MSLDSIQCLPQEILSEIFSYLSPTDRNACSLVNKEWREAAIDLTAHTFNKHVKLIMNSPWENALLKEQNRLYTQADHEGMIPFIENTDDAESFYLKAKTNPFLFHILKKCYFSPIIQTQNDLIERIQSFANRVSLNQNARLLVLCLELKNIKNTSIISIEIKSNLREEPLFQMPPSIAAVSALKINSIYNLAADHPQNNLEGADALNRNTQFDYEEVLFATKNFSNQELIQHVPPPVVLKPISEHFHYFPPHATMRDDLCNVPFIDDKQQNYLAHTKEICISDHLDATDERTSTFLKTISIHPTDMSSQLVETIHQKILNPKFESFVNQVKRERTTKELKKCAIIGAAMIGVAGCAYLLRIALRK
ncbi:MAG: F-box protein [Chlamydiota bacterium]